MSGYGGVSGCASVDPRADSSSATTTSAMPVISRIVGIWRSTTTPISVAVTGRSASSNANFALPIWTKTSWSSAYGIAVDSRPMQRPSSQVRESAKTERVDAGLGNEDGGGEDHRGQRHPDRQRIESVAGVGHPLSEQDVAGPHRGRHQREQHAGQVGVELHSGQQEHAAQSEPDGGEVACVCVSRALPPLSDRGTRWRPRCRAGSAKSPRRWRCSCRSSRARTPTRHRRCRRLHRGAMVAAMPAERQRPRRPAARRPSPAPSSRTGTRRSRRRRTARRLRPRRRSGSTIPAAAIENDESHHSPTALREPSE